jgi:hypothetical protein
MLVRVHHNSKSYILQKSFATVRTSQLCKNIVLTACALIKIGLKRLMTSVSGEKNNII